MNVDGVYPTEIRNKSVGNTDEMRDVKRDARYKICVEVNCEMLLYEMK